MQRKPTAKTVNVAGKRTGGGNVTLKLSQPGWGKVNTLQLFLELSRFSATNLSAEFCKVSCTKPQTPSVRFELKYIASRTVQRTRKGTSSKEPLAYLALTNLSVVNPLQPLSKALGTGNFCFRRAGLRLSRD